MGEVVELDVITCLDLPAERILNNALKADLEQCVVVGWDKEGDFYFASTYGGSPEVIYLLEMAKKKLLDIGDE